MVIKNLHRNSIPSRWYVQLCFILLIVGCDFGNTNLDPTRPLDAELKELLPSALTQTAHNLTSIGGRVTGTVIQHYKGLDAQPESYSQYMIDERTLDAFWRTGLYGGAMKDCDLIIEKATVGKLPHYAGIAKIIMAINLNIATTMWGDVPFSEAFDGIENLQPTYDAQQKIFESIQRLLADAIIDLNQQGVENNPQDDDLIFQGDHRKWINTARALQARYYLHQSKRNAVALSLALEAINAGVFNTREDEPNFKFGKSLNEAHPLPLYSFERAGQLVMGEQLFGLLNQTADPRMSALVNLVNDVPLIYQQDSTSLYWGQFDAIQPFISLAEIRFIEAEVLLLLGNPSESERKFQEAVIAHLDQMEIDPADYELYVNEQIHFGNRLTIEQKREWILQQKHIALFGNNPIEAWVDYRRTGFPKLIPPPGANSSFNPSLVIPRRYLYPISERNSNGSNLQEAIRRQGGQLMDNEMWAFE